MKSYRDFEAGPDDEGRRLDRILRRLLPAASLSELYRALRRGDVRLQGRKASPSDRVSSSDRLAVAEDFLAGLGADRPGQAATAAAAAGSRVELPSIILETRDLLFVSKPRGMLSHGPGGLDLYLRERYRAETAASLSFSPGPLHRLDRNTSGIVACSRSLEGARRFSALLRGGGMVKSYLALLEGRLAGEELWEDLLARDGEAKLSRVAEDGEEGRVARSKALPLCSGRGLCLALVRIETGRTHQIRAQAAAHGHPLAGDRKYGGGPLPGGPFLHAWRLDFLEPPFPDLPSFLETEPPADFASFLDSHFPGRWRDALRSSR